ncbi:MAG: 2-hydroxychromene-2-carboxylate isomerase [Hyphomicrobiales bacterium]|nr:2-hydroxychromene-2-carboxylate isomerase [Hyphomicrobiales bacterium]
MPDQNIDYYFSMTSPWAYLGHQKFVDMARRHGLRIIYHPVNLGMVFPETGGLPLAKRHPARQAYRLVELQRWREKRGVELQLKPKYFPMNPTLADCCVAALGAAGGDVPGFMARLFAATFAHERDGADAATLTGLLNETGADGPALVAVAGSAPALAAYEAASRAAVALGIFGSPTYVRDGELFWGQDRLELLEDAITSGRAGFRVP